MSSGQREPSENVVVESDAVEQQARLGFEPQGVQEQQNIEGASIQAAGDQQGGLGLASGAIQPTQVASGHISQEQPNMEDVVQWQRRGALRSRPLTEQEERTAALLLRMLAEDEEANNALVQNNISHTTNHRAVNQPTQAALGVEDNGIQARTGNHQTPNGRPQQGRATRRMPNQQMPDGHPQQGTARRRMRLQMSSLHSVTDSKGNVLGLERSDASSSCNELHAISPEVKLGGLEAWRELKDVLIASTDGPEGTSTCGRKRLDRGTGKLEGYIEGLRSAESKYSTLSGYSSSLTSRLPSLATFVNLFLGLLGSYVPLWLSRPLK